MPGCRQSGIAGAGQDTAFWVERVRHQTHRLTEFLSGLHSADDVGRLASGRGDVRSILNGLYVDAVRLSRTTCSFLPRAVSAGSPLTPLAIPASPKRPTMTLCQLVRWSAEDLAGVFDVLVEADPASLVDRTGFRVEGWQFPWLRSRTLNAAFVELGWGADEPLARNAESEQKMLDGSTR